MKLQLIGTGSITAPQTSASSLIDDRILIDCGTGVTKELLKRKVRIFDIEVILITHLHGDHFFDLPYLILLRSFNEVTDSLKIYGPKNLKESVEALFAIGFADLENIEQFFIKGNTSIIEFDNLKVKMGDYNLESVLVDHGKTKPSYGYIVEKDGKRISFSGDSCYCQAIEDLVLNSSVAVLECGFPNNSRDHMGPETIEELSAKGRIITTHMSLDTREKLQKMNLENVKVGADGDIFYIY
ncbi:MAG TPA: ribonuclease Z [Erysipelotrichaceae bacterium]|nr:ribonuclease Z [Erysipelotrichaceae bacterium]